MFNTHYSLEETAITFDGRLQQPVICAACYQAIAQEKRARSCPRSYAALASSDSVFIPIDWNGLGTTACRCCGSTARSERWTVEVRRRMRAA